MKINKLIREALDHVRKFHPEVVLMIIKTDGAWCFMDEDLEAPVFHDDIDKNKIQLAVDSAQKEYGLPYIYEQESD